MDYLWRIRLERELKLSVAHHKKDLKNTFQLHSLGTTNLKLFIFQIAGIFRIHPVHKE